MTIKVTMPQMGESVYEGTLTKWLKKEGDAVTRDEPLFEISTDKVDSEIPSPASGVLSEILVPEGQTVQINAVLAVIKETGGEDSKKEEPEPVPPTAPEEAPKEFSSKDAAPESAVKETSEDETVNELRIQSMPDKPDIPSPKTEETAGKALGIQVQAVRTSPLVRKIARENNVDLLNVPGTGLEGRITKEDILNYLEKRPDITDISAAKPDISETESQEIHQPGTRETAGPDKSSAISETMGRFVGETENVPMSPMRKAIAEHMVYSKRTSAHVHTVFEVNLQPIVQLRNRYKEEFKNREGIPLTYTPFFAKALIDNVRDFPVLNASVSGEEIIYKKPVNLGIAVALDTGLIVPVIKNAHLKSLTGIALKIADLADRARSKRLKPEDVQNGTISLTNPGLYGALFATPIISQPQVAILGIGGIEKRPVVIDDAIAIRSMVCLSLSYDHRIIDGAVADQFMAALKNRLQSWTQWID